MHPGIRIPGWTGGGRVFRYFYLYFPYIPVPPVRGASPLPGHTESGYSPRTYGMRNAGTQSCLDTRRSGHFRTSRKRYPGSNYLGFPGIRDTRIAIADIKTKNPDGESGFYFFFIVYPGIPDYVTSTPNGVPSFADFQDSSPTSKSAGVK